MTRVSISADTASVALGADGLADAFVAAGCTVIRTGSRGLFSIEPLAEVEMPEGRIGYGPVAPGDVAAILRGDHPNPLAPVDEVPFFAKQQRFTFARCGIGDPLDLAAYASSGGWRGLARARSMTPQAVVDAVKASGLRGRGGAGFPTGIKWQTVLAAEADEKFIVCNADEGDSGTFAAPPADAAIFAALGAFDRHQPLNARTGTVHAAALCAADGAIRLVREDVGRHTAFDKRIGAMARAGSGWEGGFALLSSRCSFELVEKAALAGCPTLVTVPAPTTLALDRAREAGLRLIVSARPDAMLVAT